MTTSKVAADVAGDTAVSTTGLSSLLAHSGALIQPSREDHPFTEATSWATRGDHLRRTDCAAVFVSYRLPVALFRRRKAPGTLRQADSDDRRHLEEFVRSRTGVEAYVEPRTTVTDTTVVLVASSGEWTRRRVPSPQVAHEWANSLGIPSYDAGLVGYPQRMR